MARDSLSGCPSTNPTQPLLQPTAQVPISMTPLRTCSLAPRLKLRPYTPRTKTPAQRHSPVPCPTSSPSPSS